MLHPSVRVGTEKSPQSYMPGTDRVTYFKDFCCLNAVTYSGKTKFKKVDRTFNSRDVEKHNVIPSLPFRQWHVSSGHPPAKESLALATQQAHGGTPPSEPCMVDKVTV